MNATKSKTVKVIRVDRLRNSLYGNPRFEITFIDGGETLRGKTESNASFAYSITGSVVGKRVKIAYKKDKKSNVKITNLSK